MRISDTETHHQLEHPMKSTILHQPGFPGSKEYFLDLPTLPVKVESEASPTGFATVLKM